jgi:hypothetical protein
MKVYARLTEFILKLGAALGLYFKGRSDAKQKAKIKGLQDKVKAHDIEDDLEGNSSDDDVAALTRLRDDD